MVDIIRAVTADGGDWPEDAETKYERIEVLGKGSFGMVWMARRPGVAVDDFDDEYVAIKNINIKDEKGKVYAEREISILQELRHPNVIRLIRAFPVHGGNRLVIMQLARGPNLHQLVVKRGALGLPLSRLVSRHLIAAVSYLHGRAVIHRDIKPSNCILACNVHSPTDTYDWYHDDAIWSNGSDGEEASKTSRWKLMLVDFGFARALEKEEIIRASHHLRNSIVFESNSAGPLLSAEEQAEVESSAAKVADTDGSEDTEHLESLAEQAALSIRGNAFEATNKEEDAIMGSGKARKRESGVSMPIPFPDKPLLKRGKNRMSTARQHVRSMSALGTKAYAAPEIRKKLRHKTESDFEKANAAMTECVADYGMIVDAYSVGWTLRVAMTGVPPNFTISEYMRERDIVVMEGEDDDVPESACCCLNRAVGPTVKIRDPSRLPHEATLLITTMTEKKPEDRMTVREAQNHPWIAGGHGEEPYSQPQGDFPSSHGDPVVPLGCASQLSKLTVEYHMH